MHEIVVPFPRVRIRPVDKRAFPVPEAPPAGLDLGLAICNGGCCWSTLWRERRVDYPITV